MALLKLRLKTIEAEDGGPPKYQVQRRFLGIWKNIGPPEFYVMNAVYRLYEYQNKYQ